MSDPIEHVNRRNLVRLIYEMDFWPDIMDEWLMDHGSPDDLRVIADWVNSLSDTEVVYQLQAIAEERDEHGA